MLLEVAVSGTVGKQTVPTNKSTELKSVTLTPSAANATLKIRDGNASGEVVFYARLSATAPTNNYRVKHKFTKGMHVKVIGANAVAYVELE